MSSGKLLGRSTAGSGVVEELTCTAAGLALLDDADAAAQRTTLGLGTAATANTGTSAGNVVVLDGSAKLPAVDGSQLTGIGSKQIQPITASVGSNALTITLNPTSLDFRSATLGSGTVNTRTVSAAISVVVSSGSTLGTVNATQSRLAVLAIDNAGTVELAVVNLSGGNQLDECNLISTTAEGGAGAADSANVIYSTTARSNVPYRVVGYVESTQATAGTWATAPSTIQGAGGNALTGMLSLGYGQTWQNVTASRAHSTDYTNSTGRPIKVSITCNTGASSGSVSLRVDGLNIINAIGFSAADNTRQLYADVPNGSVYRLVNSSGSAPANITWMEHR